MDSFPTSVKIFYLFKCFIKLSNTCCAAIASNPNSFRVPTVSAKGVLADLFFEQVNQFRISNSLKNQ